MTDKPTRLDPSAWDSTTFCFLDATSRDAVADEARTLEEHGLRIWVVGPYVFVAGPRAVVAAVDHWVAVQIDRAQEIRAARGLWPDRDVD